MIIYLDADFKPVPKEKAALAKVFPEDGSAPYFIAVEPTPFVEKGQAEDALQS